MPDDAIYRYRDILRADFCAFIERAFLELNPQTPFLPNWHIEVLSAKLEAVRLGRIRRLIINVPPRSLKSHCASIAFPAWLLGHDPSAQILAVSYAQELSDKHARDSRMLMTSPFYKAMFRTRLSAQKQATAEFETTERGYRLSTSVGGVLTGRGANFIIIDDPMKPEEALSDARRKSGNDWYAHTLYSRLNDKARGVIVIIMQRLHEDDLVEFVQAQEPWDVLSFPAIAENDEEFRIDTPYGPECFRRRIGDVLHPLHESRETLDVIRETIGAYNYAGQYQQSPAPLGGGMIKVEWFKTYEPDQLPSKFETIVQSWDTANKASELSDYSVCTTWGIKGKHLYLLNVFRKRLNYPDLKRSVREQYQAFDPEVILIEDKASGTQLIQELIDEGVHAVKKYTPEHDKKMRMNAQTATIENGFVHLPHAAHWLADYLHELATFPNVKHDDQADSTAQALAWIKQSSWFPGAGILGYYREEVARKNARKTSILVRMKAPPGVTHYIDQSGVPHVLGPERIVEVMPECVLGLLRSGWSKVV